MESFSIHIGPLPRQFPHVVQVNTIGYIKEKDGWVDDFFGTFNFSFILSGEGEFSMKGKTWRVKAPCVITQWPGCRMQYGPDKTWEELYITFLVAFQPALEASGLADIKKPIWHIGTPGDTRRKLADLREHLRDVAVYGRADEIDRICEAMVLESRISESKPVLGEKELAIREIRAHLDKHFLYSIDFDELALDYGLSPATFRRYWARMVNRPPAKYVMELRLRQARRMLVETQMPIGEIADALGFDDPLYFSRKFRDMVGETATTYRRIHSTPMSLDEVD